MDPIQLIKDDHRTVEELFRRFQETEAGDHRARRGLADRIIEELSVHGAIEEEILYPVLERFPDGRDLVEEAVREHQEVRSVLRELEELDPSEERFDERMGELIQNVLHHAQEEERDLLPRLQRELDPPDLEVIGERLREAKQTAPTSPA